MSRTSTSTMTKDSVSFHVSSSETSELTGESRRNGILDRTSYGRHSAVPYIRLSHDDYTVGWICALPVELTAAKGMLDVEHITLPTPANDGNVYTLGSICGHNTVITCLPSGSYGTTNAAVAAAHMMSTFGSIIIPLMVGIGGGVPKPGYDIRLGDVVISSPTSESPAVIQYDFGKTGVDGNAEPKGFLNKPLPYLLRAVTNLKATHQLKASDAPKYISSTLNKYSLADHGFAYPGSENDILFGLECGHGQGCSACGYNEAVPTQRPPRSHTNPIIHYGTIASGNQVIKHGPTRDRLAEKFNVLCFEMEAAGLMDEHRCLVIRGICDYCDAYKDKNYQAYSALSAAAVAKELLSTIPAKEKVLQTDLQVVDAQTLEHRQVLMNALDFEQSNNRRATVKRAHTQTCRWLLDLPEYLDWIDQSKFGEHQGLLWIKGKPGTGKSTIMKFVLEQTMLQKMLDPKLVVISFFFNARGHELEKTTDGLYRSLIHQLMQEIPEMQALLDGMSASALAPNQATSELFENLFRRSMNYLGSRQLICLVDALDECPEDQIRRMVEVFEDIGELGFSSHIRPRLLFSSRHYPNISISIGMQLVLEEQDGHRNDLIKYIDAELKIGKNKDANEIKDEILHKSAGIFLWVILAVQILRREYDKGRVQGLKKRLHDIPLRLNELFREIITHDNERPAELVLCMQWVLYAARPLSREELYFGLLAGSIPENIEPWDPSVETTAVMDNFILDTSKGLVELTRSKPPSVQFIHESVRQFLLQPSVLASLGSGQDVSEGQSHQQLRESCDRQIHSIVLSELDLPSELPDATASAAKAIREKVYKMYPFLNYSIQHVLHHADQALRSGISQSQHLQSIYHSPWLPLHNVLQTSQTRRLSVQSLDQDFRCMLARQNLEHILTLHFDLFPPSVKMLPPILVELANNDNLKACTRICKTILSSSDSIEGGSQSYIDILLHLVFKLRHDAKWAFRKRATDVFETIIAWCNSSEPPKLGSTFCSAVMIGDEPAIALLCEKGVDITGGVSRYDGRTPLSHAVDGNNNVGLLYLLAHGAEVSQRDDDGRTPLHLASAEKTKILLLHGADLDVRDDDGRTPLHHASAEKAKILLSYGAEVDVCDGDGRTPLYYASADEAKVLLAYKAEIDTRDYLGKTLLHYASVEKAKVLISFGANLDIRDDKGWAPLHYTANEPVSKSSARASVETAKILLAGGADVDAPDNNGDTTLHWAAYLKLVEIVRILLRNKAQFDARNTSGRTCLNELCFHTAPETTRAYETAKLLLHKGAAVNDEDLGGRTPIHWAFINGNYTLAEILYNHGADLSGITSDSGFAFREDFMSQRERIEKSARTAPCCKLGDNMMPIEDDLSATVEQMQDLDI